MTWKPVSDKYKYGVVIQNFDLVSNWAVHLKVGNTVHIMKEVDNWYYGYSHPNREVCGIFPKEFVYIKNSIVDKTRRIEIVTPRTPPIIQELTAALKEWGPEMQRLFVKHSDHYNKVYDTMNELIVARKKMLSGKLPANEVKQVKQFMTHNIDLVNRLLGLDLVVRDSLGNILNPDITSTAQIFRHHHNASELVPNESSNGRNSFLKSLFDIKPRSLWTLYTSITNIILKVPDPCEISLSLYINEGSDGRDLREGKIEYREKPLTEPYLFTWTPSGYSEHSHLFSTLRCCFTDLGNNLFMHSEKQIYIFATVVREGGMSTKENERWSSTLTLRKNPGSNAIRRPYGIFVAEISSKLKSLREKFSSNSIQHDHMEVFAQFFGCGEKDTLESVFKRYTNSGVDGYKDNKNATLGMWLRFYLLNGDMKQIHEGSPTCLSELKDVSISYRLGLSDLIAPNDVRNDLYVTLIGGEFSRERNVEVVAKVCNGRGVSIPGVLFVGCGEYARDEYRSVTYHHEGKPRWIETFKVALPIEEFRRAHLKFIFKHRSTNEMKDRCEKPFAMSFANLMQPDGTTLLNTEHELLVYKIDSKKFIEEDTSYLKFPCVRRNGEELTKIREEGLSLSLKDSFTISSLFCSTKLTQNAELLSLLEWGGSGSSCKTDLKRHLSELRKVPSEELTIFLQDTLDVLFEILIKSSRDAESDNLVFLALVDVIDTAATQQKKHGTYHAALDTYIDKNFSATLAYTKLISIFKHMIDNPLSPSCLNKAMKCLYYVIKFICRSWNHFYELYAQGKHEFEDSLENLLVSIANLMSRTEKTLLTVQEHCLKFFDKTLPDIMAKINHLKLSHLVVDIIVQDHRLSPRRLSAMNAICHSSLFLDPLCRNILLEAFIGHIKRLLAENDEQKQLRLSVKNLADILDILFSCEVGSTVEDLDRILRELMQDILSLIARIDKDEDLLMEIVAIFVSIIRQVQEKSFILYVESFSREELVSFFNDMLVVIQSLLKSPVFPNDWFDMNLISNFVFMKLLKLSSKILLDHMLEPFIERSWINYFQCIVQFTTQLCLQLEKFSSGKRNRVLNRYRDLRKEATVTIIHLWQNLGVHQLRFVGRRTNRYSLVRPFLEITLLPVVEIRKFTIPVFFEMMRCEYYSPKEKPGTEEIVIKGKFNVFECEMLEQLDSLLEDGKGDEHYREVFIEILTSKCNADPAMTKLAMKFVKMTGILIEKLLQYRTVMNATEYSSEIKMSCTANLLDFYATINRKELYIRYVYKLFDLHCECNNFTEAGYTLKNHADLLTWEREIVPEPLRSLRYPHVRFHADLKEELYSRIIVNFCKGKMWMAAVNLCKELISRHEEVTLDYNKVSKLYSDMSEYYKNVMNSDNSGPKPEYFRVAYYGRGFPAFLQNKVFVYRGNDYERLTEFQSRILDQFHNAELMKILTPPTQEIRDSPCQYIQINHLNCVPKETKYTVGQVAESLRKYYEFNHINTFTFYRPFHKGDKDPDNEFATLWTEKTTLKTNYELPGLLRCFSVIEESKLELSPLENSLEGMATANKDLVNLIKRFSTDSSGSLDILTRKLSGMVDAAVMGGIKNYEKAFLTDEYLENNTEDYEKVSLLKCLIRKQIPLLSLALDIHGCLVPSAFAALHVHLMESFKKMKSIIQNNYGSEETPEDLQIEVNNFKRQLRTSSEFDSQRTSQYSLSSESNVSSLIKLNLSPSKGINATLPRGIKLSSGGTATFRKEKKDKALRYLLRRDSLCGSSKSSTSWFDRPDSGIFSGNNSSSDRKSKTSEKSQRGSDLRSSVEQIGSTSSISSFGQLALEEPEITAISDTTYLDDTTSVPEDDIPPPLPVKERNLDIADRMANGCSQMQYCRLQNLEENEEPPEKPPRPPFLKRV